MELTDWNDLRPCVQRFAQAMEARLRANDHKPGKWLEADALELCDRIQDELDELMQSIEGNEEGGASGAQVMENAADVANFAMMVFDLVYHHPTEATEEPKRNSEEE